MNQREHICVTGMGIVSSLGCRLDTVSRSLKTGRSGIVFDPSRKAAGFRSGLTSRLLDFDPSSYRFTKKQLKTMGQAALFASAAARDAVHDASLDTASSPERIGIIIGNDSSISASYESVRCFVEKKDTRMTGSGAIFQSMTSTASMNLAALLGVRGYNITISAACASGSFAIGHACQLLRTGILDAVICGGAQELNAEVFAAFDGIGAFSLLENDPQKASRDRDGLIPSGGGAILVLERESFAKKRGAPRVYGRILGFGFSSDGAHLSVPTGEGGIRAMRMALDDAALAPGDIDYVNAHATSTPEGDRVEAEMIASVLGPDVPVSSTKSLTGHECWMAGASEAIYSFLMMRDGFLCKNANFITQDPGAPKIRVLEENIETRPRRVMSNSFGFGGTNAVLVFGDASS
jgi:3-oxoacyl-[acyl-carrier-protein] synthase-1